MTIEDRGMELEPGRARELLFRMMRIRCVEETIAERYTQWEMRCPTHLSTGQEAVPAAVGMLLNDDDFVVSTHRCHAHYVGKGGSLPAMIAEIHGKATGCSKGKGGSMHLVDLSVGFMGSTAIVGNTIPVGVGLALSIQLKGGSQISCVFLGDGAVEEGVFYESLNFSVLRNLPILFICENNFYSVYSPIEVRQPPGRVIAELAAAIGCRAEQGDGNDAVAAYGLVEAAVRRLREGDGPQFLEFETFRWREHCGPFFDDDLGYRDENEVARWRERDPIATLGADLLRAGAVDEADCEEKRTQFAVEVAAAFDLAKKAPFPEPAELLTEVTR